jgi:hypothetical protein
MMRGIIATALVVITASAAACGGGASGDDTPEFPRVVTLGEGEIFPQILSNSLTAGENRFVMALLDAEDEEVLGASVRLRFYELNGDEPELRAETDARFIGTERSFEDEQAGGERTLTDETGAYVAHVAFAQTGDWGVEVRATVDGQELEPATFRFNVLDASVEPAIGEAAPASRQRVLADVGDVSEIDSSVPPRPGMHEMTIADAVASGRPSVIAFATPAFCRSRLCAPVMDNVMDPLFERYSERANFVHVEPYELETLRSSNIETPVQATRDWRLQSEPWIFVVDGAGRIAAKFEGIMAADEVEAALVETLSGVAADSPSSLAP